MDPLQIESVLRENLTAGPPPEWELLRPDLLQIWWREAYGEVVEREQEFLLRFNLYDRPAPGVAASRFHWNRRQKGTPDGALGSACELLKIFERKRDTYSFVEDPIFGLLCAEHHFRDGSAWDGTLVVDLFDRREATIHLISPPDGPTESQRAWFREFLQRQAELRRELDQKILAYYREYNDAVGCDLDLHTVADVPRHINPSAIRLQLHNEYDREMFAVKAKLMWDASWDDEHGVDALLHDFRIIEVGAL